MSELKSKVFVGIAWRTFVDIGQMLLQIVFTAILARILSKSDFGLVAMALLVNRFLTAMTQIGFGVAIIQSQDIKKEQVSAIFCINTIINFFVSLVCFLGAPLAAAFFSEANLVPLIRLLAWVIFIDSFGFPQILLRKKLKFGAFSALEISTMLFANLLAVILALKGYGFWALAIRVLLSHVLFSIGIWFISDWFPSMPNFKGIKKFFNFGLHMLGSKIFDFFSQNLAAIITGKFIGVETLGSFNIAYNLGLVPAQKIQSILTAVLTPAFSSIQSNLANFKQKFLESLYSLGTLYIPLMIGLSVVAPNFVIVLYGSKWKEAGLFLVFLAPIGLFIGIQHVLNSVIISRGLSSVIFKISLLETSASIPLLFAGSYFFDIIGLIIAYLLATCFSFFLSVRYAQKAIDDNTLFIKATQKSFLLSMVMAFVVIIYSKFTPFLGAFKLITQVFLGGIIYLAIRIKFLSASDFEIMKKWPFAHLLLLKNSRF